MRKLMPVFLIPFLTALFVPTNVLADGMFVVPKFVWDKHKDINEPTQKAILVYDAGREDLILQVKYQGPVDEFGWLIPVPNLPTVQEGSMKCFYELSQYTQRRFEGGYRHDGDRAIPAGTVGAGVQSQPPVEVIQIKTVGAYEIAVLSTKDSGALARWLDANRFYFPTNKTDVLDDYVKQQWYFIAVKINLSKSGGFQLFPPRQLENRSVSTYSTALKLAGGELNPLQISFANDRCVFPLKISSVNGKPSEVQVYVLSPGPLLERTMLEKKLPLIYSNDLAQAKISTYWANERSKQGTQTEMQLWGSVSPEDKGQEAVQKWNDRPFTRVEELLPYAKVTKTDLLESRKFIPRLADKAWWLTKQTWTFKPEEMRDLEFEPAFSYFSEELGSQYGYFAAESLTAFGSDGVPAILAAMKSTNPIVRVNVATHVWGRSDRPLNDARLNEAELTWLKDSEPDVRMAAIWLVDFNSGEVPNSTLAEPFIALLDDPDIGVRFVAALAVTKRYDGHASRDEIMTLFHNSEPFVRLSGLTIAYRNANRHLDAIERELALLKDPQEYVRQHAALILSILTGQHFTEEQADRWERWWNENKGGYQDTGRQSVALALPLLSDSNEFVRQYATAVLRALTGKHFTDEQIDQWQVWWTANKTNFVVQQSTEDLGPLFPRFRTGNPHNRPALLVPLEKLGQ